MAGTSTRKPLVAESRPLELLVAAAAAARVRGLLLGGASFASVELADFLCFEIRDGDSAASSADASREEGCKRSVVEDLRRSEGIWVVRFRLAEEPVEEGDDMGMRGVGMREADARYLEVRGSQRLEKNSEEGRRKNKET